MTALIDLPPATKTYYQPVNALLNELRHRQRMANDLVTWLNAVTVFSDIERRVGLSST